MKHASTTATATTTTTTDTTKPVVDIQVAQALYRFSLHVVDPREPVPQQNTPLTMPQPSHSAYWFLLLAIINNLGCLAHQAADHDTVQVCLAIGLHAVNSINLPNTLSWNSQVTWCNPSPAA